MEQDNRKNELSKDSKIIEIDTGFLRTTHDMLFLLKSNDFSQRTVLDFSNTFFRPFSTLLLISTLKQKYGENQAINYIKSKNEYIERVGLYKYLEGGYNFGGLITTAGFGSTIVTFNRKDFLYSTAYIDYDSIEDLAHSYSTLLYLGEYKKSHYTKFFKYFFREIFRNFIEHSYGTLITIFCHILPKRNSFEIAFFDNGRGLEYSLSKTEKTREKIMQGQDPISIALEPGITSKSNTSRLLPQFSDWANSGYGLSIIKEFCLYLKGTFTVISNKKARMFNYYEDKIEDFDTDISGVGIQIRFIFKNEFNYDELLREINKKLEIKSGTKSSGISRR